MALVGLCSGHHNSSLLAVGRRDLLLELNAFQISNNHQGSLFFSLSRLYFFQGQGGSICYNFACYSRCFSPFELENSSHTQLKASSVVSQEIYLGNN